MKLTQITYKCAQCGQSFKAPALPESAYGEFLPWSNNGNVAAQSYNRVIAEDGASLSSSLQGERQLSTGEAERSAKKLGK